MANYSYSSNTKIPNTFSDPYTVIVNHGTHHSCQFVLNITIPTEVMNYFRTKTGCTLSATELSERMNIFCTEVSIPQTAISSDTIRLGGEGIEIPYDKTYGELTLSFYIDSGYQRDAALTKALFDAWQEYIYSPVRRNFAYPNEYTTKIEVSLYSMVGGYEPRVGDIISKLTVFDAWPTTISNPQLSGSSSEPSRINVTWKYRYSITDINRDYNEIVDYINDFAGKGYKLSKSFTNTTSVFNKVGSSLLSKLYNSTISNLF